MSHAPAKDSLSFWQKQLAEQQMPVLAQTANAIVKRTSDDSSSAAELARLILQDVSMTTRVLRLANSIYYNPGNGKITTISRAIVLLGFDAVRNICLSISMIDTFLRGPNRALAMAEMAQCFHAAVQAKSLAEMTRQQDPEEVFIATLLYHLGALAFWCFASGIDADVTGKVQAAIDAAHSPEAAEQDVLGFRLQELTSGLNQTWALSPLLQSALDPRLPPTPRTRTITIGHDIARIMKASSDPKAMDAMLAEIERTLRIAPADARARITANARTASETITLMGSPEAARLIPQAREFCPAKETPTPAAVASEPAPPAPSMEGAGDRNLQLEILRELSVLIDEPKPNINLMLEMVLEGLYRGVGMDRTVFALLSPDRKQIRAKFLLGKDRDSVRDSFSFPVGDPDANPIAKALQSGQSQWITPQSDPATCGRIDADLTRLSGGSYFLMPLSVAGKAIGCLYADRGLTRRPLDAELFGQFKLFGQQARMALTYLKGG